MGQGKGGVVKLCHRGVEGCGSLGGGRECAKGFGEFHIGFFLASWVIANNISSIYFVDRIT